MFGVVVTVVNVSKLVLLFLLVMVLPFCVAENFYQKDVLSDLKVNCINNGSVCSGVAVCNLSLVSPDGVIIVDNQPMSRVGEFFNYSFNFSDVGVYKQSVFCSDGGLSGYYLSEFKVTPSGLENSFSDGFIYVALLVVFLILMVLSFVAGFGVDANNSYDVGGKLLEINYGKHLKTAFFFLGILFFWFLTFLGWQISDKFLMFDWFTGILKMIFMVVTGLMPVVLIVFIILTVTKWLADHKLWKLTKRGLIER